MLCVTELVCIVKYNCFLRSLNILSTSTELEQSETRYLLVLSPFKHLLVETALVHIKGQELWYVIINK